MNIFFSIILRLSYELFIFIIPVNNFTTTKYLVVAVSTIQILHFESRKFQYVALNI